MPNKWEAAPIKAPAPAPGVPAAPGLRLVVPKPSDPYKDRDQQLQEEAAQRDREQFAYTRDKDAKAQGEKTFDNTTTLRKEFQTGKEYTAYSNSMRALSASMKQPETPEGDLAVIYNYAKIMDPDSAVREGELELAASGASLVERMRKKYNMVSEGATLPPGTRDQLIEAMRAQGRAYNTSYSGRYKQYADLSQRQGIDPTLVVGDHLGDEYKPGEQAWVDDKRGTTPIPGDQAQAGIRERVARGDDPAETIAWLIANGRPPNKEQIAQIIANAGNRNPVVAAPDEPGALDQFGTQAAQIVAGGVEGLAMLPDMAAKTAGQIMALPVDALGFDQAAAQLRNPLTVERGVKAVVPERSDTLSQVNRFGGQLAGGVLGFPQRAAQAVTNRILGGSAPARMPNALAPAGQDVMRAADELSASVGTPVQPLAADVAGATVRRLTSAGAQLPLSARPIVNAGQRLQGQAQTARNTIAGRTGEAVDPVDAGEAVTRGLGTYRVRTSQQARTMYQAAEKAAEGAAVQPKALLERIGEHIRTESQIPGGSDVMPILEKLAVDLTEAGTFSISGVRGMRTVLQSRLTNAGMTPTNAQRIVNELVQAAGDDIATSLTAAGKTEAAKAYRSADKFWAERMDVVNNAIKPIIGKNGEKSGEEVARALQQAARGNAGRLSQVMRALPEEDAATVRATLISQLGRASKGTQDASGNAFSLNQFLTHWNELTPRARSVLFDQRTMKDLNNLAIVASGSKQASRYANASNTGSTIGLLGTGATIATDIVTMAGTALAQIGGGAMLAAPGFARWLAKAPREPRAMKAHIARLTTVAEANPALADDIMGLQQRLLESLGQPGRLAAEQDVTDVRP